MSSMSSLVKAGSQILVPQFNRDIRPILFENCVSCHGPDAVHRKAELRLDQRDSAVTSGAIVPNHRKRAR